MTLVDPSRAYPAALGSTDRKLTADRIRIMPLIVILDDQLINVKIFRHLAQSLPDQPEEIVVRTFRDPLETIWWLEHGPIPDLVVTDYQMPNLDGAEFIRRFRALPGCAEVPIIAITSYEDRQFRLNALEAGATDFLQSPVDHHEFRTRARNLLKLRRQQLILETRTRELARDLAESEQSRESALRDSSERLAQVIDTVPMAIRACDRDGRIVFANSFQAAFSGRDTVGLTGTAVETLFEADDGRRDRALDQKVFETEQPLPPFEEERVDRRGKRRVFLTTKTPLRDAGHRVVAVLTSALDITERKHAEAHLLHIARHDVTTGLTNRAALFDRMRRELARSRRGDRSFALLFIDLDGFKQINDLLGHSAGDGLLRTIAERLSAAVPQDATLSRIGGDEFAVLLNNKSDPRKVVADILAAIDEPFLCHGRSLTLGASIGVAVYPQDGADIDELMKNADLAMYRAKSEGGHQVRFWRSDMRGSLESPALLDTALRDALAEGQFELYYQPQYDVAADRIVGAEALLRWNHPVRGVLAPNEFLPRAEENGLIVPINEWVVREACREAASWRLSGLPPLRVAVNLSPIQFRRSNVPLMVVRALAESGLDPHRLDLEITETIVMDDAAAASQQLRQLSDLGIALSVDDFGTGYSSLHYLKRFPIDRLKIDQCFVRDVVKDPSDGAIVRAIINLGHSLGLKVLAEGVETDDQMALLAAEGCDELQGYRFGRPMPARRFVDAVRGLADPPLPTAATA